MGADLLQLYQDVVLAHNRRPRNYRVVEPATHAAVGHNPLCGDTVDLRLEVRDGVIHAVGFQGEACAIATASASILTATLEGRSVDDARAVMAAFREALHGAGGELPGDLDALQGVRRFPGRLRCAELAWGALESALDGESGAGEAG